jgi:hypothetical protein
MISMRREALFPGALRKAIVPLSLFPFLFPIL